MNRALLLSERYKLVPQMKVYDHLPMVLTPYMTLMHKRYFSSPVVNTDQQGFRLSYDKEGVINSITWKERKKKGIILGGSFAFGVGATSDAHTISSILSSLSSYSFLNLGIRAGNSTQELIALLPFYEDTQWVIVCSGMNNLVVGLQSLGRYDLYGSLFNEEIFEILGQNPAVDLARIVNSKVFSLNLNALIFKIKKRFFSKPKSLQFQNVNLEYRFKKALELQKHHLIILRRWLPSSCKILFAVQPFSAISESHLSIEEKRLFDIIDQLQRLMPWSMIKEYLKQKWPLYVQKLEEFCYEKNIAFIDLNKIEYKPFSYVDHVHMRDEGYSHVAELLSQKIAV